MSIQVLPDYNNSTPEMVVNATRMSADQKSAEVYEFVLDLSIKVVACKHISSVSQRRSVTIKDFVTELKGELFELNHVRINPKVNNELILFRFKKALQKSGVKISNPPDEILMAICYKPIGELSDVVRFYVDENYQLVFLSKAVKLSLV